MTATVAGDHRRGDPAGGIGEHHGAAPRRHRSPHREHHRGQVDALVGVAPAGQQQHPVGPDPGGVEGAGVVDRHRDRKAGQVAVADRRGFVEAGGERPETGAEHDGDVVVVHAGSHPDRLRSRHHL